MSQNPVHLRAPAEGDPAESVTKHSGSDNLCSFDLVKSESKAVSDSKRQRQEAVGLRGGRNLTHSLEAKLAARTIHQPNGCWEVQGYANRSGHQQIAVGSPWNPPHIRIKAHILAWEIANGQKVPKGMVVMHLCDNPPCVNPAHLKLGTQRENIYDSIRKGRYNTFGLQKLNAEQVREIRALAAAGGLTQRQIGARFNVARNTVSQIVNRKVWAWLDDTSLPSTTAS